MLYYVPLECYQERYTSQLAAPRTGWLERNWIRSGVQYRRIDGVQRYQQIKTGSVLDAVGRSVFSFSQIEKLLYLAETGQITDDDVIYFDDFWTPGIEALAYAFHLMKIKPRMYAFLYAQSVDEYDFTYPMRDWIRPFEKGIGSILDGIFVCCPLLQDLVVLGEIAPREKVHSVGLIFDTEEVQSRMNLKQERQNKVVFSSRWDAEKNPLFFLEVVRKLPDVQFVICTGAKRIRSNDLVLLGALRDALLQCPNLTLKENLTKEQYYNELCTAKIQFNCASQDFVSFTLLEASAAGCYPAYPRFRSFPEALGNDPDFMYRHCDATDAASMISLILKQNYHWGPQQIESRAFIHRYHNDTWRRMLKEMKIPC